MYSVTCERSTGLTPQQVRESRLFGSYVSNLSNEWRLLNFRVVWAVRRHTTTEVDIIMMFAEIEVRDEDGRIIKSGALLRGATVEILPVVIAPSEERFAVLVQQSRVPAGSKILSTPAGMTDGKSVTMTAVEELDQEIGHPLQWSEPIWLNRSICGNEQPMLVSPGGSSEEVMFCAVEAHVTNEELASLNGRVTGVIEEDEQMETVLMSFDRLPRGLGKYGRVCLKTAVAFLAYTSLPCMWGGLE